MMTRRLLLAATSVFVLASITGAPGIDAQTLPLEVAENFELVGHEPLMNRGMNAALAIHGDYAYVGSRTDGKPWNTEDNLLHAGVMVVDISDPANLELVHEIGPPHQAVTDQTSRELRVWTSQDLLIVMNLSSNCSELIHICSPAGGTPDVFSFYDIAGAKAAAPEKLFDYDPSFNPHEFFLWEDPFIPGRALLFISATANNRLLVADISTARSEKKVTELGSWSVPLPDGLHSMGISNDGMTAYFAHLTGGVALGDTSDLANGKASPQMRMLTTASNAPRWSGPGPHSAVKVWGEDYMLVTDEVYGEALKALGGHGCPWGWTRFVDISDPARPTVKSEYKLPQNEASFCQTDVPRPSSSISAHNPTLTDEIAFITWHSGGLQAIDLDDPENPTQAGQYLPGPLVAVTTEDPALSAGQDKVVMWSFPIIQDGIIYVTDVRNGLYALRYTGEDAASVAEVGFLEGNSNLGDALGYEPPNPCDRDPVPPGYEEECEVQTQ